jgi:hypothetical protein
MVGMCTLEAASLAFAFCRVCAFRDALYPPAGVDRGDQLLTVRLTLSHGLL